MESVALKRHRGLSWLAWGILIAYLLASCLLAEMVYLSMVAIGCFDGYEPACTRAPLPLGSKLLLWGLWIGAGVLAIRNVWAVRRAGETTMLRAVGALALPLAVACAFVVAYVLLYSAT